MTNEEILDKINQLEEIENKLKTGNISEKDKETIKKSIPVVEKKEKDKLENHIVIQSKEENLINELLKKAVNLEKELIAVNLELIEHSDSFDCVKYERKSRQCVKNIKFYKAQNK